MTFEEARKEIIESGVNLGAGDYIDIEALKVAVNALGAIKQIRWERDIAIEQLGELGLGLGQKVDHVKEAIEKSKSKALMKTVKKFNFPSFEEWYDNERKWEQQIGSYICEVGYCGGRMDDNYNEVERDYKVFIYPINNYYYGKILISYYEWDIKNENELKKWYEDSIKEANIKWEEYILKNYFV